MIDAGGVAFRMIVSIKADHPYAMESRVDRCNELVLAVNATRLKLIVVATWRCQRDVRICIGSAGKIGRADVVRQILVDPPAI